MASHPPDIGITLSEPLAISITVPETLPINKEGRVAANDYIEERFEAAMQRRRDFIHQFEQDTGMELDATRRDSVLETEHPNALAKANHGAIKLLLEAWYERVGIQDAGWTRFNQKSTIRACRAIREILEKGDEELGIPIDALEDKEQWTTKMDSLKWWFFSLNQALDYIGAYGIGDKKFGSGVVRVEVMNYTSGGRCMYGSDHTASMVAWRESETRILPNHFPPMKPCGCYEFRLLMKTVANARGLPAPGDEGTIRLVADTLRRDWLVVNRDAHFDRTGWPTNGGGSRPAKLMLGEEEFEIKYYKEEDRERGISLVAIRIEGRFGELL